MAVFQMSCLPGHCRTSEELKYTMTRLAMDGVDLFIVEHGCAANVKVKSNNHLCVGILTKYLFMCEISIFPFLIPRSPDGYRPRSQLQPAQPGGRRGHQRRGAGRKHPAIH